MVIDHVIRRYGREPLNYHHYVVNYPDVHAAGVRIYGSWKGVIEACGIDYSTVRIYRKWSKEKIIEEIKKRYADGEPISSNYAQKNYKPLYMAVVKRFKGWREAVILAGIDYDKVRLRRSMTPAQIKKEILALHKKGVSLAYTNMRANYQYLMAAGMKKLGDGSWDAARKACGIYVNYRSIAQGKIRDSQEKNTNSSRRKSRRSNSGAISTKITKDRKLNRLRRGRKLNSRRKNVASRPK
jgi:hypothetical protein